MKPILYIFCGLPFSGKTLLAQEILKKKDMVFVSIDEIKFAHGFMWTEDEQMTAEEWQKIFNESYEKTHAALLEGEDVLYDSANQNRESRNVLRKVANESNTESKVIFMNVSEETVRRRWRKNYDTKERFHLPERFFNAAFSNYEPPTEDENLIIFNEGDNVQEWVSTNF